eukprot:NODE_721_length_1208_cov_446.247627_g519_i0.p2 GENE.NODE_721_length_1208_cov_446.247627_g519_i0~~NODE_721_length_1208_cov_446.247627_g519_i0.p2  ORF type:complete len:214 (-),score=79.36 NODE_721_length_1208_cov_446.247627_g519_i0:566-1174(-)
MGVGIVTDLLVEFQTFFGQAGYFVHGIQLLPITPAVHLMFHPVWVAKAFPRFKAYCDGDPFCTESGFVTFMIAEWALVDKDAAWDAAMKLKDEVFDISCAGGNGNSRVNTLYFISSWGNHPTPKWPAEASDICQAETTVHTSGGSMVVDAPSAPGHLDSNQAPAVTDGSTSPADESLSPACLAGHHVARVVKAEVVARQARR